MDNPSPAPWFFLKVTVYRTPLSERLSILTSAPLSMKYRILYNDFELQSARKVS